MTKIVEELNQIQIDVHAMYVKLHNHHWSVQGLQFFSLHNLTEDLYDEMSDLFDETAERALQIGGKPITCLKTMAEKTKIKPETRENFDAKDVLKSTLADFEYLRKSFVKLSDVANEANDKGTVGFADENIAKLEKHIWMIKTSLAK